LLTFTQNCLKHCSQIAVDILIREPHNSIAGITEPSSSGFIVFDLLHVRIAIDFDHQFAAGTVEVHDEPVNRVLAPELETAQKLIS
jgi:hypothetical protein